MIVIYLLSLFGLLIYSFSQIDLNLTLFQSQLFLNFQHWMIVLGYFNRPLSTLIFIFLTTLLGLFSIFILSKSQNLSKKNILILLFSLSLLALFSYPAFSHDIFNGMFNARQIVLHHANPYTTTPLMFPNDTWTRFMQWTHATYPWGPAFLFFSVPFYLLGLGKFTLTLISFKLMALLAFLGSASLVNKMSSKKGLIFFILNPLIIYEALIAAHLDIIMLFFALLSWHLWQNKKTFGSLASIALSIGTKYATVLLLPAFIVSKYFKKYAQNITEILIVLSLLGTIGQIFNRELLPHYFIVPIGFIALSKSARLLKIAVFGSVLILLIRYIPFLYTGEWQTIRLFFPFIQN